MDHKPYVDAGTRLPEITVKAVFLGALILIAFASIEFVDQFYSNNSTPLIVKIGVTSLVFG